MPINEEQRNTIKKQFDALAKKKFDVLDKLKLDQIDLNPYLLRVLGFETPEEIAEFIVSQRLERSLVTSFGTRIQNIAKALSERGTGVEGADICKERDGIRHYIQIKSGSKTANKDISSEISRLLTSATRRNSGSIALLGMTYGKRERVSNIIQQYSQVNWKIGREFWSFIAEDDNCAQELFEMAGETNYSPDDGISFKDKYREKVQELATQIREKYGDGEDMWERIFEDNM